MILKELAQFLSVTPWTLIPNLTLGHILIRFNSFNLEIVLQSFRSYAYILLHCGPALVLRTLFSSNKVGVFMTMRCVLGLFNVLSEMALYKALGARLGNGIARLYIAFSILSSGMFISRLFRL